MKTLLALLMVLMLTVPVLAQDDDAPLCLRDDTECPCIEGLPQTCPVVEDEPPDDPAAEVVITPQVRALTIRLPAFRGLHGLIAR